MSELDQVFGTCEHRSTRAPKRGQLRKISNGELVDVEYSEIGETAIFEGDIILAQGDVETLGIKISDTRKRWDDKTLVYDIDANLPDQERVTAAIAHWEEKTVMKFKKRTSETSYVLVRPGSGCSSAVGRQGGVQFLNLASRCTLGNAIHEIGHAVGLWHEQSREDRGDFIEIKWDNIDPLMRHNFNQHIADGDDVGPYDYGSIMHYPKHAFALDTSKPTIVTPNGEEIGQRQGLSAGDIAAVAAIYA